MTQSKSRPKSIWESLARSTIHKHSPSNLTELELFCKEDWANISGSRCAKLVETYPKIVAAVIAAKGGYIKNCASFLFVIENCVPPCFGLSHKIPIYYIYVCGHNVTKCGKVQGVWILLQATESVAFILNMILNSRRSVVSSQLVIFFPSTEFMKHISEPGSLFPPSHSSR